MFKPHPKNPELSDLNCFTIESKADLLLKHFEKIEDILNQESASLTTHEKIESERTKNDEDDSNYNYDYSNFIREIEFVYLRLHRYASILAVYAYLESSMSEICHQEQQNLRISISAEDLKGEGIVKFQEYLKKIAQLDISKINDSWSHLLKINLIRNCIIHCNGNIENSKKRDQLIKIISTTKEIETIEGSLINLSPDFVKESIFHVKKFLIFLVTNQHGIR